MEFRPFPVWPSQESSSLPSPPAQGTGLCFQLFPQSQLLIPLFPPCPGIGFPFSAQLMEELWCSVPGPPLLLAEIPASLIPRNTSSDSPW